LISATAACIPASAVKGSIISFLSKQGTKRAVYRMTMTISCTRKRHRLQEVMVAEHPLVALKFLDEDNYGSNKASNP